MHKLVILIESLDESGTYDQDWPEFLHLAESMPGLIRETTSRVEIFLYGQRPYELMHELYFESLEDAQQAMASPQGSAAGKLLQRMTRGHLTLFFADHKEDDLENIRRYQASGPGGGGMGTPDNEPK